MKKIIITLLSTMTLLLAACSHKESSNTVTVGTISGPETQLMQVAQQVAKKRYGLHVKIISFSDYNTPNQALHDGDIDANAFQHLPFLQAQNKARGFDLVSAGKTFLYPMGIYSKKIKDLKQLKRGSKVAIPNDPSNESRALLLLQKAGLIILAQGSAFNATPVSIIKNPKHLQFVELDAAQLPRALQDVSIAAINTNYAIPSGLHPKDALFIESTDSPYTNVIAVRRSELNNKNIKEFVQAYQSPEVKAAAKKYFGDAAIAGWSK